MFNNCCVRITGIVAQTMWFCYKVKKQFSDLTKMADLDREW